VAWEINDKILEIFHKYFYASLKSHRTYGLVINPDDAKKLKIPHLNYKIKDQQYNYKLNRDNIKSPILDIYKMKTIAWSTAKDVAKLQTST